MKRLTALLCALSLLVLCACGEPSRPYSTDLVDTLLESDVFSEPLEPLDREIACFLYRLDGEQAGLTDLKAYRSSGSTCEEAAVLVFETEDDACAALSCLEAYLAARLEDCRDYMPDQAVKLEHTALTRRANTLLLLVADDWTSAADLIK